MIAPLIDQAERVASDLRTVRNRAPDDDERARVRYQLRHVEWALGSLRKAQRFES